MSASVLVTGGGRSGKSRYAIECARALPAPRVFIATAEAGDAEMAARITAHRAERGAAFTTVEVPRALTPTLGALPRETGVAVIDCVTLWVANLLADGDDDAAVRAVEDLAGMVPALPFPLIVVTNEVGAGIIPFDPATRRFRDLVGLANQRLGAVVDRVVLMVAGLPMVVKPTA